jgi:hypothetical protein
MRSQCHGRCSRKFSRSLPGCGHHPRQHEGAGSAYDRATAERCALTQGKQRVLALRSSQPTVSTASYPHSAICRCPKRSKG